MTEKVFYKNLNSIFDKALKIPLSNEDNFVIFSDLHMGDGSSKDDFKHNSELFLCALKEYYFPRQFKLILNGDVEELQRFKLKKIMDSWGGIYNQFNLFRKADAFYKTVGNHDLTLVHHEGYLKDFEIFNALRLNYQDDDIFLFHGHQASKKYETLNHLIGLTLKYIANPLRIKNYSVSHSSKKQYKLEKKVYHYSSFNKIASIIGHTHRPLFESLSKAERLKYKIDQLCREYSEEKNLSKKENLSKSIRQFRKELKKFRRNNAEEAEDSLLYESSIHLPCLFNSGCVIGKRGMTGIEISGGEISLIHWFDKKISKKYLQYTGYEPEPLGNTDYFRMVINQEKLDYVFSRIKLLA